MDREKVINLARIYTNDNYRISGDELQVPCTYRSCCVDGKRKFYFNMKKERGHCFRCGYTTGNLDQFLTRVLLVPYGEILGEFKKSIEASYIKSIIRSNPDPNQPDPAVFPAKTNAVVEYPNRILSREVITYLRRRGFKDYMICRLNPHYSIAYPGWMILPIYVDGLMRFWIRRTLSPNTEPKYLSFDFKHDGDGSDHYCGRKDVLWGIDQVVEGEEVILCEGILSAAMVCQQRLTAIAMLGSTLQRAQRALLLSKRPSRVVLALDGVDHQDNTLKKSRKILDMLVDYMPVHVLQLPCGTDPNDLKESFLDIYKSPAKP